jgi:FecR protein
MNDERFHELLEGYADATLDDEASRELLIAFAADADLKARLLDELRLQNSLRGLPLLDEADRRVNEVMQCILPSTTSRDVSAAVLSALRPRKPGVRWYAVAQKSAAIAAVLALGFFVMWSLPRTDESLATVGHQIDATWSGDRKLAPGERVGKGHLRLASGVVRLDFAKDVRLTLEGPADLELIGPGETRLHSGKLTANVPPEGIGFQVHTERAKVVDLGTTFGVSVGTNGATDVAVYEGLVSVTSLASREEKVIEEGNEVSVNEGSGALKPRKFNTRPFRSAPVLFGVINTGGKIRFASPQPGLNPAEVTDDDHLVIFPERFATKLRTDLTVSLTEPGDYGPDEIVRREETLHAEKRRVNTYLIQYSPPPAEGTAKSDSMRFVGEVSFDRPIIAIIADGDQLTASDEVLGKKRFVYSTGQGRSLKNSDRLSLSQDRRTLKLDWQVGHETEHGLVQIRVIVDVSDSPTVR